MGKASIEGYAGTGNFKKKDLEDPTKGSHIPDLTLDFDIWIVNSRNTNAEDLRSLYVKGRLVSVELVVYTHILCCEYSVLILAPVLGNGIDQDYDTNLVLSLPN